MDTDRSKMLVSLVNGPNLDRLGMREPLVYGTVTLLELETNAKRVGLDLGLEVECFQSNYEGTLIDHIHQADGRAGLIINPGAFAHYSYALRDAISSISTPTVEVHISNIHARESFRHQSVISPVALGMITGFGIFGYELALRVIAEKLKP